MRILILVILTLFGIVTLASDIKDQDISIILKDKIIVKKQIKCLLRKGNCDYLGREMKRLLPNALNEDCSQCTRMEAANVRQLMKFIEEYYPKEWRQIIARYRNLR